MTQFKDHFSSLASRYAEFRPHYPKALFEYLAELCSQRQRAWDCACGSGQASVSIAQYFESVIGTDASAQQIAQAIPQPRVQYRVGSAEHSALERESVDLVTVAQALHWFEVDRFYTEVNRVLKADGILAVWCYGVQRHATEDLDREVQIFYRDIVGPYWPPERVHVEEGYAAFAFPFEELTQPVFTMQASWDLQHLLGYLRSWSATVRYIAQNHVDPVVALSQKLEKLWGGPQQLQTISWPLAVRVGRKQKALE